MKLGFLKRKLIWRVERDPHYPHSVHLFDIFGRKLMTFESTRWGGTHAGDGNHWEDGDPQFSLLDYPRIRQEDLTSSRYGR